MRMPTEECNDWKSFSHFDDGLDDIDLLDED